MSSERLHHPSLWISDGNVVLSASSKRGSEEVTTPTEVLFRVHKGVLSRHSPVFAGMFTLPEVTELAPGVATNANEMYEGVSLIAMPDPAEQIEAMLKVLYDPLSLQLEIRDSNLPMVITPLMTIVRKYQLDAIGAHIVKHIKAEWPKTLEEWDEVDCEAHAFAPNSLLRAWPSTFLPEPVAAINFSRQFEVKTILSAAFYDLSRCYYSQKWPDQEPKPIYNSSKKGARWNLLSALDFHRLGQLKEALDKCVSSLAEENLSCLVGPACTLTKEEERLRAAQDEITSEALLSRDVLRVLRQYTDEELLKARGLCPSCAQSFATKIRTLRVLVWGSTCSSVYKKLDR